LVLAGATGFVALQLTKDEAPSQRQLAQSHGVNKRLNYIGLGGGGSAGRGTTVPPVATSPIGPATQGSVSIRRVAPGIVGSASGGSGSSDATRIVKRGSLSIEVKKGAVSRSIQRVTEIASTYGGFVQATSTQGSGTGDVEMRVPVANFEATLRALGSLGRVSSRTVSGTDVTARFVDLSGRLHIAIEQRDVLLKLLGQATSVTDTLRVQDALGNAELTIEQLQGQLRLLRNQAAQSTIRVFLHVPGAQPTQSGSAIHNPSFSRGIRHAVAGFLGVLVAVLVGLGYLIPVAALGLVVWLVVHRIRRARMA